MVVQKPFAGWVCSSLLLLFFYFNVHFEVLHQKRVTEMPIQNKPIPFFVCLFIAKFQRIASHCGRKQATNPSSPPPPPKLSILSQKLAIAVLRKWQTSPLTRRKRFKGSFLSERKYLFLKWLKNFWQQRDRICTWFWHFEKSVNSNMRQSEAVAGYEKIRKKKQKQTYQLLLWLFFPPPNKLYGGSLYEVYII